VKQKVYAKIFLQFSQQSLGISSEILPTYSGVVLCSVQRRHRAYVPCIYLWHFATLPCRRHVYNNNVVRTDVW